MSLSSAAATGPFPSIPSSNVPESSVVTIQWINRKLNMAVRQDRPLSSLGNWLSKDQLSVIVRKLGKRNTSLKDRGISTNFPVVVPPRKSTKAVKVAFIVQAVQNSPALVEQLRQEVNDSATGSGAGVTTSTPSAATRSSARKRPRQEQQATSNASASTAARSSAATARTTTATAPASAASSSVVSGQNSLASLQQQQRQQELASRELQEMLASYGLVIGGQRFASSSTSGVGGGGMPITAHPYNHPALAALRAAAATTGAGAGGTSSQPSPEDRMVSELMQMGGFQPGEEDQVKEYIRQCQQKKNEEQQTSINSDGVNGTSGGTNAKPSSSLSAAAAAAAGTSNLTVTAEEVVLFIISQREADENDELEDARLEDEIRQASEAEREKNSKRKELDFKEQCASAKTIAQITEIFPASWVLKGLSRQLSSKLLTQKRQTFIDLLKIEHKSKKWYGSHVPAHYYRRLCDRMKSSHNNSNTTFDWLDGEPANIEHKLMTLSEQTERGLPKIFVEACSSSNGAASDSDTNKNEDDDDDDDDVIVIE
mmetsp:Transcript_392/g.983  ORF Transcript_392/g.983 Transcript_392/m.983 type:complete len:542 (+) Transcript_392:283-1908(+)